MTDTYTALTPERIAELKAVIAGATWLATPTHIDAQRKAALFALLDAAEDRERLRGLLDMHERRMNRAVGVENTLLEVAAGKRQPPTPEECRALAITLGVPDEFRKAALAQEGK